MRAISLTKTYKCKVCKSPYTKRNSWQTICESVDCVVAIAVKNQAVRKKAERKETKEKLLAIKPRSKYMQEAQAIANKYARVRDVADGCISCDKPASWDGQWHGSHFRSVGAASATRFNLLNIHKACSICNNWKSGNLSEYEPRLRLKIGNDKVDWLRSQNQIIKYDTEYLEKYKRIIGKRLRRMVKLNQEMGLYD